MPMPGVAPALLSILFPKQRSEWGSYPFNVRCPGPPPAVDFVLPMPMPMTIGVAPALLSTLCAYANAYPYRGGPRHAVDFVRLCLCLYGVSPTCGRLCVPMPMPIPMPIGVSPDLLSTSCAYAYANAYAYRGAPRPAVDFVRLCQ